MNADPKQSCSVTTEAEPTATMTPMPVWLVSLMVTLLFLSAWYFDLYGGWFEPKVYAPYRSIAHVDGLQPPKSGEEWRSRGKVLYESNCALCHNPDGAGKPAQGPPLAGSEWVITEGANRLIHIPLAGLAGPIKVKGQEWNLNMAAMGAMYSDEQLADLLSYVRNSWGNKAAVVTPEQVKKVRTEIGNRSQAYTADELMKIAE
jgi:mono/diheme cytochrome c family protein